MGLFITLNRDKKHREDNTRKRRLLYRVLPFNEVGRVVSIGKALDKDAYHDGGAWTYTDLVAIYFVNKNERYYRCLIKATDMYMNGFIPKYGQTYRFHSKSRPVHRESYALLVLDSITSV